jgi:hypothetical protein
VSTPELQYALEVRDEVVWVSLHGALRAAGRTALAALARARRVLNRSHPTVVDLSGLEVADALGVAALCRVLRRFAPASVVLPPPWTQACTIVRAHLAGFHVVERASDLDLP